ncbi:hypothetical protein RUMCAL_02740 [Ruminococcus callidus ATCC 27760]|uniref:Uncharacterized protein n=1 Tax=Ruminococcus callidus ATCC 27760 TaxID=411473 RepID=U2LUT3_9FIRM|nr:hypothetical protein RUMCAL_02740 [Ruminococcus callidus ATCC 27760]
MQKISAVSLHQLRWSPSPFRRGLFPQLSKIKILNYCSVLQN